MRLAKAICTCLLLFVFQSFVESDQPISKQEALEIFSNLKKQTGVWRGRSTKGWENRLSVKVIARGSVVMTTSEFIDSPGEGMASMFYMDGDRLLLTHYCEAGNQPTLVATSKTASGDIIFEFSGATNLPTRDTGHMDKAVFHFIDENHYTSQWTWFSKGRENWMEVIEYERLQ